VPGVFAPVQIDGHMLVDGGIAGNLPVEIIREMNVDVIIAVDVEFLLYTIEELRSAIAISEQMLTILIRKETARQIEMLGDDDILIRPELGTYGSADFGNILTTVEPGIQAASAREEKLRKLSVDDETYASWLESRARPRVDNRELAFVRLEQDSEIATETFETRLRVSPGDPIEVEALADEAARLHGLALFEKVGYRLVEEDGDIGVVFDARSKSWGPAFLRFGISLEDDFEDSTRFDARVRMIRPAVNSLGGEWRADLRLGSDLQVLNEFYQPLRFHSRFFVAPYLDYEQTDLNLFADQKVTDVVRISELTGGFDLGAEFGSIGEFRLGVFRGHGGSRVIVGDPTLPTPDFNTGGLRALLRLDTLNDAWFPRKGLRADIEWRQSKSNFGADGDYDTIAAQFDAFTSRGKTTLGIGLEYATTLNFDGAIQDLFQLGGFQRLSGFERNAINGPHAALARFLFYRRIGDSPAGLFDAPVYFGASVEAGNVWESRSQISAGSALVHGSLFIGVDSYIGPLILAAGVGEGGNSNFYLFIGAPPGR
jgi:NTE family protein